MYLPKLFFNTSLFIIHMLYLIVHFLNIQTCTVYICTTIHSRILAYLVNVLSRQVVFLSECRIRTQGLWRRIPSSSHSKTITTIKCKPRFYLKFYWEFLFFQLIRSLNCKTWSGSECVGFMLQIVWPINLIWRILLIKCHFDSLPKINRSCCILLVYQQWPMKLTQINTTW